MKDSKFTKLNIQKIQKIHNKEIAAPHDLKPVQFPKFFLWFTLFIR